MANTFTSVIPQLLAQGLMALRERVVMPRIVNRGFEALAGQRGSTIDVPIPSAITVQTVAPAATPPSTADVAPTSIAILLDQWKEAAFYLTDKEILEVQAGTIPMQASEAIKAIANDVDKFIFGKYVEIYGYAGAAGATPFGTNLQEYVDARKTLANQLADDDPRFAIIDTDAEANAILLRAFQDASFGGGDGVIMRGQIGSKLGALWAMSQNVPTHTAGTGAGILVNNGAGYPIGTKTGIVTDTGTGTLVVGDIISFAGHSQTYAVTAAVADVSTGSVNITPGLTAAIIDNEAVTLRATHVVNLLLHRDAFAFATRPLERSAPNADAIQSAVDPESGLALRLEVSREHKRTRFSYDILYGAGVPRPEFASRMAG